MVYSCIGAEFDSDGSSSTCDIKLSDQDFDRSTTISDAPVDSRINGHVASSKQQTERQMEPSRQEMIIPLTDSRSDLEEERQSGGDTAAHCGLRPEPPPHSNKPGLAVMRQRHLQESSGTTRLDDSRIECVFCGVHCL